MFSSLAFAAQVTLDTPTHRGGQTFLTWTEVAGGGTTYSIYRQTAQITSLSGLTPVATGLTQDSGRLLYNDDPGTITDGQNLTTGFIITEGGSHLASNKGLIVWTTAASGCFYYAVTNSGDASVSVGTNSSTTCVTETSQAVPGAVMIGSSTVGGHTLYRYFAWEDYATWDHSEWGYYGYRFNVFKPTTGISPDYPLLLYLHQCCNPPGYVEPAAGFVGDVSNGVEIHPVTLSFESVMGGDPYTGTQYGNPAWLPRFDTAADLYKTAPSFRVVRYAKLVRDNAMGDGVDFEVDANRVYLYGASMGSAAMHIANHNTDVFAATQASVGYIDMTAWSGTSGLMSTKRVDSLSGQTIAQWLDMAYQSQQQRLLPTMHPFSANDTTISPANYPAAMAQFETDHQPYVADWTNTNHVEHAMSEAQWTFLRFRKDEAFVAFGSVGNSDTPPSFPSAAAGQRNEKLDFDSSLNNLGGGTGADIYDHSWEFRISVKSTASDTTGTITVDNTQNFVPTPGATISYNNVAGLTGNGSVLNSGLGTITVGARGEITIPGLAITAAGNRLFLYAGDDPYVKSSSSYAELPLCTIYGQSSSLGGTFTIDTFPGSSSSPANQENFKVKLNGVQTGAARGWIFVEYNSVLWLLASNGRWYFWSGSEWNGTNPESVGCRLPPSADGSSVALGNYFLVDAYGGTWVSVCSEEPLTYGYRSWCPNYPGATLEPGIIIRNAGRFNACCGKRAMDEPNNTPWSLKYCGGEMYLLEYNVNPLVRSFTKWGGLGVDTWLDATGDPCLDDAGPPAAGRVRMRRQL